MTYQNNFPGSSKGQDLETLILFCEAAFSQIVTIEANNPQSQLLPQMVTLSVFHLSVLSERALNGVAANGYSASTPNVANITASENTCSFYFLFVIFKPRQPGSKQFSVGMLHMSIILKHNFWRGSHIARR